MFGPLPLPLLPPSLPPVLFCSCTFTVALALLAMAFYNAYRFGSFFETGHTQIAHFDGNILGGLYGHLFSVGRSVFIYSPPLVLTLAFWRRYARIHRPEALLVGAMVLMMLAVYSQWSTWHGAWCYGNRYLLPLVPLLALPLPIVLERAADGRVLRWVIAGVWILGGFIQVLGSVVNIAFVHHAYGFTDHGTPMAYLYVPSQSQLVAHMDAALKGQHLDPWIIRAVTDGSLGIAAVAALPWVAAIIGGCWLLAGNVLPRRRSQG